MDVTLSFAAPSTLLAQRKKNSLSRVVHQRKRKASPPRLHAGARRVSPGGGSIISSQHRAGADGEGLPLDGELREYLKATYLKPLRDAERENAAGPPVAHFAHFGAMPTMGDQSKPAAPGATATLHDTLADADAAVRANTAVGGVANSVNTDFSRKAIVRR